MVGGVDEEGVAGDFFASESSDFAEQGVGLGDVGEIAGTLLTRDGGIHMHGRNRDLGWIIAALVTPRYMRMARADEKAERLLRCALAEELRHLGGVRDAHRWSDQGI